MLLIFLIFSLEGKGKHNNNNAVGVWICCLILAFGSGEVFHNTKKRTLKKVFFENPAKFELKKKPIQLDWM